MAFTHELFTQYLIEHPEDAEGNTEDGMQRDVTHRWLQWMVENGHTSQEAHDTARTRLAEWEAQQENTTMCEYLDSLLERTDEGSIARAVDHVLPEYKIDVCGGWYYEDETEELPESVPFMLVEKAIYELYGYSSVELVTNVMKILHGLKMFIW